MTVNFNVNRAASLCSVVTVGGSQDAAGAGASAGAGPPDRGGSLRRGRRGRAAWHDRGLRVGPGRRRRVRGTPRGGGLPGPASECHGTCHDHHDRHYDHHDDDSSHESRSRLGPGLAARPAATGDS